MKSSDNRITLITAICLAAAVFVASNLLGQYFSEGSNNFLSGKITGGFVRLALILVGYYLLRRYRDEILVPVRKNYFIALLPAALCSLVIGSAAEKYLTNDAEIFWVVLFVSLTIGLLEEIYCRRLLFMHLLKKKGDLMKAALLSSFFFGVFHVFNLIGHELTQKNLISVFNQMMFAFSMGMLMAGLYARSGSFLGVVLFHSLWDFSNIYKSYLRSIQNGQDNPSFQGDPIPTIIGGLLFFAILFTIGYQLLRSAERKQEFVIRLDRKSSY
ncbi:MAG: CPBP family intramembrane glutamic endopeptidase [Saprospiraceae bacterium]